MKKTLVASVHAIAPTKTSAFANGSQRVTLRSSDERYVFADITLDVSHEQARELGALFGLGHVVTIQIETAVAKCSRVDCKEYALPAGFRGASGAFCGTHEAEAQEEREGT